jgi:hypothetical protein
MTSVKDVPLSVRQDLQRAVDLALELETISSDGELADRLYNDWFLGRPEPELPPPGPPEPVEVEPADALRASHADTGCWSEGWTVERISNRGRILAERDGMRRLLDRVDFIPLGRPCLPPRVGDLVAITLRRDQMDEDGAYWFTVGGGWKAAEAPAGTVRLYWNVSIRCAPRLVDGLTRRLGGSVTGYALKVFLAGVTRADSVVLYLLPEDIAPARKSVLEVVAELAGDLREPTPPLTLRLAPGLALAEDPGNGQSFGQNRCGLVAEALAEESSRGRLTPESAVERIIERFRAAGLDPDRPYLAVGNTRVYQWPRR